MTDTSSTFAEVISRNARKAASKPTTTEGLDPLLILFDVDGLLVFRSDKIMPDIKQAVPVLNHGRKFVYLRPHLESLMKSLSKQKDCIIGFYTSMKHFNAEPITKHIMKVAGVGQYPFLVFNREHTTPDPDAVNDWDTIRDLQRVWDSPQCFHGDHKSKKKFGAVNTLLVDDEVRKIKKYPENSLLVTSWNLNQLTPDQARVDEGLVYTRMAVEGILDAYRTIRDVRKVNMDKIDMSKFPKIFETASGVASGLVSDETKTIVHAADRSAWSALPKDGHVVHRPRPAAPVSSTGMATMLKDAVREAMRDAGVAGGHRVEMSFDTKIDHIHEELEKLRTAGDRQAVALSVIRMITNL